MNVVGVGGFCELCGQCWPVVVGANAGVDRVEQVMPLCGVGPAVFDGVDAVALQQVLYGTGGHRVLRGAGEAGVGGLDSGGGPEHRDLGGQGGVGVGGDQWPRPGRGGLRGPGAGVLADLVGQVGDKLFTAAKVVTPVRVFGQSGGDGGQPAQRPAVAAVAAGEVDAVVQDRGRVGGIVEAAAGVRGGEQLT